MKKQAVLIVGAGLSGAVMGRLLAEAGYAVDIIDKRDHVAGICYTRRDALSNIMIHQYAPHVFHTNDESIWQFVSRFAEMMPYYHRVKVQTQGQVFCLPVNLHTLGQFYNKTFLPDEARDFIDDLADNRIRFPGSYEEQALRFIGKDLYEAFFKGYVMKQWGMPPAVLPASVLRRLPVRFDYNDQFFCHKWQGMPKEGYHQLVENILAHENIHLFLQQPFSSQDKANYQHIFYSGRIDEYFAFSEGLLDYRTLDFECFRKEGSYQGTEMMYYCDEDVPYTRIIEYKYFTPWESFRNTVYYREYIRECGEADMPCYPVRILSEPVMDRYVNLAQQEKSVTFIGRLGTYRYLDMDVTIKEAFSHVKLFISHVNAGTAMPAFNIPFC